MSKVKILIMDVDGTLTDGKIYMGNEGEVFKAFNIKDGYGIHDLLPRYNIEPVIITGRSSNILVRRCQELGIGEFHQGIKDKLNKLQELTDNRKISFSEIAYIGDDLNDYICMKEIKEKGGITACPSDASDEIKKLAEFVCIRNGGEGAVREFINYIIND